MQTMIFYAGENDTDLISVASVLDVQYKVLTMSSLGKMLAILEKRQPGIILLDYEMKEISAAHAIAKLRKVSEPQKIPVVFLAETVDENIRANALALGAQDILSKADISTELLNIIKKSEQYTEGTVVKKTVLAVDDQETSLLSLHNILNDEYIVYTAGSGRDAVATAQKYVPDIILLDILMLDMDGYQVITELKESEMTKHIPVIFITGLTNIDDEEKGLLLGAADYITKPFSPSIVKRRVHNQIRMLDQLNTIERISMMDALTELPNRRSFEARIDNEWSRVVRDMNVLSILMIDVDHFKNYNDTWGHQQGDVALKRLARVLEMTAMRATDFAARWGGEEFIMLLPGTDKEGAIKVAEQVRRITEATIIHLPNGCETHITVSIGVNTVSKGTLPTSTDDFILGADKALYEAKNSGRNRVCFYNGE